MNLFFKPIQLVFSTVLLSIIGFFSLCADGGEYDNDASSFAPEAYVKDKSYEQLFYSVNMFYGEEWYDNAHSYRFGESIVADWQKYLDNKVTKKQLTQFILSDSSNTALLQICSAITSKKETKWSTQYDLKDTKVRQFFVFTNLAKSIETYTNNSASWNYNTDAMDPMNYMDVAQAKKIENIYTAVKDPFLKERYWFLTMKAYFYSKNRNQAVTFFNATQSTLPKNELYYRGLSYVAGVLYKNKDYARSNFMYSVVFDNCPKLRTVATYCFHPKDNNDFNQALLLAKTNTQKAAVWTLYGYYADEVKAIDEIYAIDPSNKHLDYLLTRAINIAENRMNSSDWGYTNYGVKTKTNSDSLTAKTYQTIIKIANAKNTASPHIWNIAAGYFEVIKGNNAAASKYFELAQKSIPNTKLAQEQLKLFQVFNEIASVKKMDTPAENKLLPSLKWLFAFAKDTNQNNKLRTTFLMNWSRNYIASLYKKQGNEVMAELFVRDKDFYLNPTHTEKMQAYFLANKTTDWNNFANSLYNVTLDDIYEYKAIKLAYNNQIPEALIELQQSKKATDVLLGNPFNGNIKDCNDCDHAAYQKTKYTKLSFLQKIKELQDIVSKGGNVYTENILLGNAFYNMSYYGNARYFYDNDIINQYNTNYLDELYTPMLMSNVKSKKHYVEALAVAKNDEQKAKAIYLLTKIERNAFYLTAAYIPGEVDYKAFDGFQKLKNNFSKTKYYQDVINECGYFKNYAAQ